VIGTTVPLVVRLTTDPENVLVFTPAQFGTAEVGVPTMTG